MFELLILSCLSSSLHLIHRDPFSPFHTHTVGWSQCGKIWNLYRPFQRLFIIYDKETFNILHQFVHHSKSVMWWKCNEVLIWLWKRLSEVLLFSCICTFWFSTIFGVLHFQKMLFFCSQISFQLNMCIFVLVHHALSPIVTIRADTYIWMNQQRQNLFCEKYTNWVKS